MTKVIIIGIVMSCNSPNKLFYLGKDSFGKMKTAFTSRKTDYIYLTENGYECCTGDPKSALLAGLPSDRVITDCDLIPCGQCIGCRIDYSRQWASRLMLEKKSFSDDQCFFITLTYDDNHLPRYYRTPERTIRHKDGSETVTPSEYVYTNFPQKDWVESVPDFIDDNGEVIRTPFFSVSKRDVQIFMKRLRNTFGSGLRFFAATEYGEKSLRPHIHLIVFGIRSKPERGENGRFLPYMALGSYDKYYQHFRADIPYKKNFRGDALYESPILSGKTGLWTDDSGYPIGRALVSRVTFDTCSYVTRYIVKKRKKIAKDWYEFVNIEPERCLMSRRPGLGREYFEKHYDDIYVCDELSLPGYDCTIQLKPPRYFDTLLEKVDPGLQWLTKQDRRAMAEFAEDFRTVNQPDLDMEDIFHAREDKLAQKVIVKKGESL